MRSERIFSKKDCVFDTHQVFEKNPLTILLVNEPCKRIARPQKIFFASCKVQKNLLGSQPNLKNKINQELIFLAFYHSP